jgi:hypothetical protein
MFSANPTRADSLISPDLSFHRKPELVASCLVCAAITLRANRICASYQVSLISFCLMGAIHDCGPLESPIDNSATRDYSSSVAQTSNQNNYSKWGNATYYCSAPGTIGTECWGWIGVIALTLLTVQAPVPTLCPLFYCTSISACSPNSPCGIISSCDLSAALFNLSRLSSLFSTLTRMLHPSTISQAFPK